MLEYVNQIFNEVNEGKFVAEDYGELVEKRNVINGEMIFYLSKECGLERFIIYVFNGKMDKLSFHLSKEIFVKELEGIYGEIKSVYNFRDNVTVLFFLKCPNYKIVKSIQLEFPGSSLNEQQK